jgi:hypothetical protein
MAAETLFGKSKREFSFVSATTEQNELSRPVTSRAHQDTLGSVIRD